MKRVTDAMPIMTGAETRHKYKRLGCVLRYAVLFTLQTVFFTLNANAQNQPEYRLEIGGGIGALTYLGDFNGNLFKEIQPMGSILAKYRFDPRMALALNMSYGQLKGSSSNAKTYYPDITYYSFKTSLVDVGLRYEYNFWPYGTGEEYRGAKRLTPYIYIGMGMTIAKPNTTNTTEMAMNIPLGGGVKYKIGDRLNLGVEWTIHFSTSDLLDGVKDPYGIKSSGMFKNTDCYSQLRVSVTYDLWAKCKTCHNDND